jgi:hypothetical protein
MLDGIRPTGREGDAMSSNENRATSGTSGAVLCRFCGKITGYKAVPGSEQEHRDYLQCITALQTRIDGLLTGLTTAATKERQTRSIDLKKLSEDSTR